MAWVDVETNIPGYAVGVYRPTMPRISSALLDCVVYLYESEVDARNGERTGGSGLLFPLAYPPECSVKGTHVYAVANAHVACHVARVIRLTRRDGTAVIVDPGRGAWVRHPNGDDVAVCLLRLDDSDAYRLSTPPWHYKPETQRFDDPFGDFLGRDVVMVGRLIGHDGKERNSPTLRFGNVVASHIEPLYHKLFGLNQESFLVEMRSIPGYSGSPVFVLPDPWEQFEVDPLKRKLADWGFYKGDVHRPRPIRGPRDLTLLGLTWCHLEPQPVPVVGKRGEELPGNELYVRLHSGMTGVVPWWKVWELFNDPEQKAIRKRTEDEAEQKADDSGTVLD